MTLWEEFREAFNKNINPLGMAEKYVDFDAALWAAKWAVERCAQEVDYKCSCADEETHKNKHECRIRGQMAEWIRELSKELETL